MKQYLILIRPYGMIFLGLTPVFAAIANSQFNLFHLTVLFVIGLLIHIFGFCLNDYYDVDVDKKSKYVSKRPLVTGEISQKAVSILIVLSLSIALIFAVVFLFTFNSFVILLSSIFFMYLYNRFSKRFFGMEYILFIGIFLFGLFGALTVSDSVSFLALLITLAHAIQWLFSVGISANLKDVEFDTKMGIRTTPTIFGVKVEKNKLKIPLLFYFYGFFIKFVHIAVLSIAFFAGYDLMFAYDLPIPVFAFTIVALIVIYLTYEILSMYEFNRDKMLIYMGFQEGFSFTLIPVALASLFAEKTLMVPLLLLISILVIWPLSWFRILFGKRMIPLE